MAAAADDDSYTYETDEEVVDEKPLPHPDPRERDAQGNRVARSAEPKRSRDTRSRDRRGSAKGKRAAVSERERRGPLTVKAREGREEAQEGALPNT